MFEGVARVMKMRTELEKLKEEGEFSPQDEALL
jgi:hypothetical protein